MPRTGRPRGRPKGSGSKYTPEIAQAICDRFRRGESLESICKLEGMPPPTTVVQWEKDRPDFAADYARAREARCDFWADQIVQISDDGTNDTYRADDGSMKIAHDHIQRSRLRVDTRKWLISRLFPRKYGEFQRMEVSGADGGPVAFGITVQVVERPAPSRLNGSKPALPEPDDG